MTITLIELCEKLRDLEETILLEKLNITASDLVDKFMDEIEENFDTFSDEFNEEYQDDVSS
jgi:hypothetical protein